MNYFQDIAANRRKEIEEQKILQPLHDIVTAMETAQPTKDFSHTLLSQFGETMVCIGEIKKGNPKMGNLTDRFAPDTIAKEFVAGGAIALSVTTEEKYFHGKMTHFTMVKEAVKVPVMLNDFIVDEYQLYRARLAGADAIVLIPMLYKANELKRFLSVARDLDLACLLECHSKQDIDRALAAEVQYMAISNRNPETYEASIETSLMLKRFVPNNILTLSVGGISNAYHLKKLRETGFDGFMIGENIIVQSGRTAALQSLLRESIPETLK